MTFARYPSLGGRVVFVTGGATGIGAEIVAAFAAQGARVAFFDLERDAGAALAAEIAARGDPAPLPMTGDVTDVAALRRALTEARAALGPIGVLVNNAANDRREPLDDISEASWDAAQTVNLRPHFFAAQAVRTQMLELGGGSIVNLSSVVWRVGGADMIPYATAKAAIVGLTNSLARAFGADDIRVNAILPGAVMTERQRRLWYPTPESVQRMVDRQVLKRVLEAGEIARMALFLGADDSRMVTKQSFVVDAGLS